MKMFLLKTQNQTLIMYDLNWLFSRDVMKSCQSAIFVPHEKDAKRALQ